MLRAALVILGKDLRLRTRDRSVLLFAFVVPMGLMLMFSLVLPEVEAIRLRAAVVDADGGEVGAGFVQGVLPSLVDAGIVELQEIGDEDAVRRAVTDGELDVAWIIPAGFSADVTAGRPARLRVVVATGRAIQGEIARGVAAAYATQIDRVGLAVATEAIVTGSPPGPQDVATVAESSSAQPPVLELDDVALGREGQLDSNSYLAAGMAAFFVFFVVQFGVTGLLEERQQGTMPRLLAAPIPPAAVHLGKLAGAFLLGITSMTVLAVTSTLALDADWGPVGGVAILIVAIVTAALGVMALVGSFARTAEQAGNLQSIVAVVLGLLGGVFFPVPGDAGLLRAATSLSPHGWFMRGIAELNASGDWQVVLPAATAIVAFGVVAGLPAVVLQRRTQTW